MVKLCKVVYSEKNHDFEYEKLKLLSKNEDFTKFISLLDTESLWFARADTFNDNYEGTVTKNFVNTILAKGVKSAKTPVIC